MVIISHAALFIKTTNNGANLNVFVCFYCNIEIFRMFEKCESETENQECLKKIISLPEFDKLKYSRTKKFLTNGEFKYLAILSKW